MLTHLTYFFKILELLMHTYLFCSPIAHAIPILPSETLQELRRISLPLNGLQGHFQCLCSYDKHKPEEFSALIQNKSYAFLFSSSMLKMHQRISCFCARNRSTGTNKGLPKQPKNIHIKMFIPLQNNIHEESFLCKKLFQCKAHI